MLALALVLAAARAGAAEEPARLGGFLPLDDACRAGWCWSGARLYPVGDPLDYTRPAGDAPRGFQLLRGIERGRHRHDGADLGDGRAADTVRAAASGLVVCVVADDGRNGYGRHLVLAHRLADESVLYTVYAHLGPGGPLPAPGAVVGVGQPLALVGSSGRASTDHLHFEVRRARDPLARWERARAIDPLRWVAARLPAPVDDWVAPLARWGAGCLLLASGEPLDARLTRARWWRLLWRSARHDGDAPPRGARALGAALAGAGVLSPEAARHPGGAVGWDELVRDLARLREVGVRLPPTPLAATELRALGTRELGAEPGLERPERLGEGVHGHPTLARALLALAGPTLAGADRR